MFPSLAAREHMLRKQIFLLGNKMFLPQVKNISASRKQNLLPNHRFPSLATMEAMLTSAKFCPTSSEGFLFIMRMRGTMFTYNIFLFIHPGSKNISLLPAKLATQKKK